MLVNLLLLATLCRAPARLGELAAVLLGMRVAWYCVPHRARAACVRSLLWGPAHAAIEAADARRWTWVADTVGSLAERAAHGLLGCGCTCTEWDAPCREHIGPGEAACPCPGHGRSARAVEAMNDELAASAVLITTGAALLGGGAVDAVVSRSDMTPERAVIALRAIGADAYLGEDARPKAVASAAREDPTKPTPWQRAAIAWGDMDDGPPLSVRAPRAELAAGARSVLVAVNAGTDSGVGENSEEKGDGKADTTGVATRTRGDGAAEVRSLGHAEGRQALCPAEVPGVPQGVESAPLVTAERVPGPAWTNASWSPPAAAVPGSAPSLRLELTTETTAGSSDDAVGEEDRQMLPRLPADPVRTPVRQGDDLGDDADTRPMELAHVRRAQARHDAAHSGVHPRGFHQSEPQRAS